MSNKNGTRTDELKTSHPNAAPGGDQVLPLEKRRGDFPLLAQRVQGKRTVYLDTAATSLKPWPVIERMAQFYSYETANVHRSSYRLANQATSHFEEVREKVARFLGASEPQEIVFTRGTTESVNLVASSYGRNFLREGDHILITELEHHSNIVPWQILAKEKGLILDVAKIHLNGELDISSFDSLLSIKTKLVAMTHCSNVLGLINPIKDLTKKAHDVGALVLVDGAQMVMTHPVNVQDLDADFYVFSGHKIFGPYGVGVLYAKSSLLSRMSPYQGGGSMIDQVDLVEGTTFLDPPHRFEAGTPNISGVIGLGAALDYLTSSLSWDDLIHHEKILTDSLIQSLKDHIPGAQILTLGSTLPRSPIVSFLLPDIHPLDVCQILDEEGIAIRSGHHCAQPLMKRLGLRGTLRASLSIYNNLQDIEALIEGLLKAQEILK